MRAVVLEDRADVFQNLFRIVVETLGRLQYAEEPGPVPASFLRLQVAFLGEVAVLANVGDVPAFRDGHMELLEGDGGGDDGADENQGKTDEP